jgi:hypothetical protein
MFGSNAINLVAGDQTVKTAPLYEEAGTMAYPVWKEMKPEEKFEFLHEWLMNVERAIKSLGAQTQGLHERLRRVEGKVEEIARSTTQQTPDTRPSSEF